MIQKSRQSYLKALALSILMVFSFNLYAQSETLQSGGWTKKKYSIKGSWEMVKRDGKTFLVFGEDFKTKNGPDLKIFLSKKTIKEVNGKSVVGSSVKISELKSSKGAQEYEIPENINLDDYASVLIHCEAYSVLWGGTSIKM